MAVWNRGGGGGGGVDGEGVQGWKGCGWGRGNIRDLKASTKEEKEVLGDADNPVAECVISKESC